MGIIFRLILSSTRMYTLETQGVVWGRSGVMRTDARFVPHTKKHGVSPPLSEVFRDTGAPSPHASAAL